MFVLVAEEADDGAPPPFMRKVFICLSKLPLSGVRWDASQHANLQNFKASPRAGAAAARTSISGMYIPRALPASHSITPPKDE